MSILCNDDDDDDKKNNDDVDFEMLERERKDISNGNNKNKYV